MQRGGIGGGIKDDYQYKEGDVIFKDFFIINKCMKFWVLRDHNSSGLRPNGKTQAYMYHY